MTFLVKLLHLSLKRLLEKVILRQVPVRSQTRKSDMTIKSYQIRYFAAQRLVSLHKKTAKINKCLPHCLNQT